MRTLPRAFWMAPLRAHTPSVQLAVKELTSESDARKSLVTANSMPVVVRVPDRWARLNLTRPFLTTKRFVAGSPARYRTCQAANVRIVACDRMAGRADGSSPSRSALVVRVLDCLPDSVSCQNP